MGGVRVCGRVARALQMRGGIRLWVTDTSYPTHDMKNWITLTALLAAGSLGLQDITTGHGGTYRGPGDTVPPGGGGGGHGGGPPTPGPNGPSGPDQPGPDSGGPGRPRPGGNNPGLSGGITPGSSGGTDRTQWQFWWGFNKDPFLNLKHHIHGIRSQTGSDEFFLGHGQKESSRDTMAPSEETIREEIVPALLRALETETSNDIVTGALIALAKIGDKADESGTSGFQQVIASYLDDPTQEIAETAAVALGILGNPVSIEVLSHLAQDTPEGRALVGKEAGVPLRTRAFATYGLGQIGFRCGDVQKRQDVVDLLWRLCESPRMATRDLKVASVIAMGLVPLDLDPQQGDSLVGLEVGETPPTSRQAQIAYLLDFFRAEKDKHKHEFTRAHAPRSIVRLMGEEKDSPIKAEVVEALAPYVDKRGNAGLRELRQSASLAFGMLGDLDEDADDVLIRERLAEAAGNSDQMVKHFSVLALGQVGARNGSGVQDERTAGKVRKTLTQHLTRGKSSVEPWAALAIGLMERGQAKDGGASTESLRNLRELLARERSASDAGAFALALGIAGDRDSEEVLLERLENLSGDEVRGHLAIALGLMGSDHAKETIQEIVSKSKYRGELLKQAAVALGLLGDGRLVETLVTMLEEAKTLTTQAALASALGFIGDYRSVEPLIAMLEEEGITDRARGFAAVALGIVADKEPLPWNAKVSVDINYLANTVTLTSPAGTGILDIL